MGKLRGQFYDIRYRLKFVLTGDCGHACDWLHPWGWVPEDGCPVHDVEHKAIIRLGEEGEMWADASAGECLLVGNWWHWHSPVSDGVER